MTSQSSPTMPSFALVVLQKYLTLTKARSRFLEMPHGEMLQNVFGFYTPLTPQ